MCPNGANGASAAHTATSKAQQPKARMRELTDARTHGRTDAQTHGRTDAWTHRRTDSHNVRRHTQTHTHLHTHALTHTHARTHARSHARMHARLRACTYAQNFTRLHARLNKRPHLCVSTGFIKRVRNKPKPAGNVCGTPCPSDKTEEKRCEIKCCTPKNCVPDWGNFGECKCPRNTKSKGYAD